MVATALARICPPCWPRSPAVADPTALLRSIDLAPRHSPDGASEIQARPSPYRTATPALRFAPCGLRDQTRGPVKTSPFLDIVPALFQAQSSRLAEGVSGDEPAAEAGAAPAGGLVTRTRATTATKGSMESEQPQWSAARRVPRSQGARGRLASVLRRVSHTRQSAAYRTAARAPFRRSAPLLLREQGRRRRPVRLEGRRRPNGRRSVGCLTSEERLDAWTRQNSSGHGSTIAHRSGPLLRCFIGEVSPPLRPIQRLTLSG